MRAKRKIRDAGIPYRVPPDHLLPERLEGVLRVLYLVFNEGYDASSGDALTRTDLSGEAIRLARVLAELMPDETEVAGLLALMLLTDARREARAVAGEIVLLEDQDRSLWDRRVIEEGRSWLDAAWRTGQPGTYSLQAAIALTHDTAPDFEQTDWQRIVALCSTLSLVEPSPVVELNRAAAEAHLLGPQAALKRMDSVAEPLAGYAYLHASRAEMLRRLGREGEAAEAYGRAFELAGNASERRFLQARLELLRPET